MQQDYSWLWTKPAHTPFDLKKRATILNSKRVGCRWLAAAPVPKRSVASWVVRVDHLGTLYWLPVEAAIHFSLILPKAKWNYLLLMAVGQD
jgi:hypothetical protein